MADNIRFNSGYSVAINRRLEDEKKILSDGNASDWSDYRYRVGFIAALQWAVEECEELYLKMAGSGR
jgi:hypothetical protein